MQAWHRGTAPNPPGVVLVLNKPSNRFGTFPRVDSLDRPRALLENIVGVDPFNYRATKGLGIWRNPCEVLPFPRIEKSSVRLSGQALTKSLGGNVHLEVKRCRGT